MAGAVGCQYFWAIYLVCEQLQIVIYSPQRVLVLAVFILARFPDKRKEVMRMRVGILQAAYQLHGFFLDAHGKSGARFAAAVSQDVAMQVAPAEVGNVDKRYAPQHEQQEKQAACLLQLAVGQGG